MNEFAATNDFAVLRFSVCSVLVLFGQAVSVYNNTCPKEISVIPNSADFVVWQSSGDDNEIVLSQPPCVDRYENLVTRICYNKNWVPSATPECLKIWKDATICINNYEYPTTCVFLTEPTVWNTNCNVATKSNSSNLQDQLIWLPFQRRAKYGPYELVSWGKDYGVLYSNRNDFNNTHDVFDKDCLVINTQNDNIIPVNCNEKHVHICTPRTETFCPKNCVYTRANQKCSCKTRSSECNHPTEIKTPEDISILQDLVEGDEECYIGNAITPDLNLKQYLGSDSWSYTEKNLNCTICSVPAHTDANHQVFMFLSFYEENKELVLLVYSPMDLAHTGDEDYIYCFAGIPFKLRKRVKVEKIFDPPERPPDGDVPFSAYKVHLEKYMNNYWCEAHLNSISEELVSSNHILAYQEKNGYEYALRLKIDDACEIFNCSEAITTNYENFIPENLIEVLGDLKFEARVMDVLYFDFVKLDYILHISTNTENDLLREFNTFIQRLEKVEQYIKVVDFRSSEYCLPQLIPNGKTSLNFPLTAIGQVMVPNELCLQTNDLPVFRMCEGCFIYGSQWSTVSGECEERQPSEITQYIHSLTNKNLSRDSVANVSKLVKKEDLSIVDVYYVSKILKRANDIDETDVGNYSLDIVDSLLKVGIGTLKQAQDLLNATDEILDSLEKLTMKPFTEHGLLVQKQNYIIHATKPFQTNVTGVLLYYRNNTLVLEDFKINTTYNDLKDRENLKIAVNVPYHQLKEWMAHNASVDLRIITTIFFDDKLFGSESAKPVGPIVDVTVPGFGHFLKYPIEVWVKNSKNLDPGSCAFWDYGTKYQRYKGKWSSIGGNYLGRVTDASIDICLFTHLTHFALLIFESHIDERDEYIMTILTYVGDFLTFFGLTGIFATAILFESWRRRQGTKILLNLSAAIIMEDVLSSLLQSKIIGSERSCKYIGPALHYIIISKYCWMLVYAFLQYVRFVKVLGPIPTNIVLKSVLFGWGFPFVPVLLVVFFNPYNYAIKNYLFCYPKDAFLIVGLLIPIGIIIITNTVVFVIVMRNVTAKTTEVYSRNLEATSHKLQFHLATLLFFVLGLPMMLGLLSNLIPIASLQTIMVYLFCITSNMQGFMLFLFYVILNKETRNNWIYYYTGKRKMSLSISSKTKG